MEKVRNVHMPIFASTEVFLSHSSNCMKKNNPKLQLKCNISQPKYRKFLSMFTHTILSILPFLAPWLRFLSNVLGSNFWEGINQERTRNKVSSYFAGFRFIQNLCMFFGYWSQSVSINWFNREGLILGLRPVGCHGFQQNFFIWT